MTSSVCSLTDILVTGLGDYIKNPVQENNVGKVRLSVCLWVCVCSSGRRSGAEVTDIYISGYKCV